MSPNEPSSDPDISPSATPVQNPLTKADSSAIENANFSNIEQASTTATEVMHATADAAPRSETQISAKASKPRIWSIVLTTLAATLTYAAISVITVFVGIAILTASGKNINFASAEELTNALMSLPSPVLLLIVPPHLGLLAIVILAAILSPSPFTKRLTLNRPTWPWWVTIAAVLAAPFCSFLWSIVVNSLFESNAHMEQMSEMFQATSEGMGILVALLCIAALPSFSEEWLFRGYIQSRLTQRWSPWIGILISSVLFAAFHMDPLHVIAVLPLGIWLGFISYRCASIIPAMLAHAYNNTISLISVVYEQADALDTSTSSFTNQLIIFLGVPSLLIFIAYLVATHKQKPVIDAGTPTT
jgi:membrane protease YdiL (CAAX protease family)